MKMQIRRGTFETNSSSVHSLTMCAENEFQKWKNGEVLFWVTMEKFGTKEQIIKELKKAKWYSHIDWSDEDEVDDIFSKERIKTYDEFFSWYSFETYYNKYTSEHGDEIVAFGYYGYDG